MVVDLGVGQEAAFLAQLDQRLELVAPGFDVFVGTLVAAFERFLEGTFLGAAVFAAALLGIHLLGDLDSWIDRIVATLGNVIHEIVDAGFSGLGLCRLGRIRLGGRLCGGAHGLGRHGFGHHLGDLGLGLGDHLDCSLGRSCGLLGGRRGFFFCRRGSSCHRLFLGNYRLGFSHGRFLENITAAPTPNAPRRGRQRTSARVLVGESGNAMRRKLARGGW